MNEMIKAVIFDIDGVLLDSFDSNLSFINELLEANGYKPLTKKKYLPLFYVPLRDVIINAGIKNEKEIQWLIKSAKTGNFRTKLPIMTKGALKTIKFLSKCYKLGIATGRIKTYVYEKPMDAVEHYISATVTYEDTAKHKPHPDPLLLAAKMLKVTPKDAVYIGDAQLDMAAARAAGVKFILYSKKRIKGADKRVRSFDKIPDAISMLN